MYVDECVYRYVQADSHDKVPGLMRKLLGPLRPSPGVGLRLVATEKRVSSIKENNLEPELFADDANPTWPYAPNTWKMW